MWACSLFRDQNTSDTGDLFYKDDKLYILIPFTCYVIVTPLC